MDINDLKERQIPWGPLGYPTYKRTYARRKNENKPDSGTEEYFDSVMRIIEGSRKQLKVGFTKEEEYRLAEILLDLKGTVAGRFLWQLGTKTVDKLGLLSLQNCAFTVVDEPIRPFTWAMDALMLGSGVGYNLQREHVYQIPKVKKKVKIIRQDTNDADFIVPDSREGWVELLRKTLEAHFVTGTGFTYSTKCIRGKGTAIKGFGGLASGPEELCWGIGEISKVLNSRAKKKVRTIDCLDVMNIIGAIVVAGNVRRSAQIAIGDYDDLEFLAAKNWETGNIPNWRAMSNNSVVCNDITKLPDQFWETYMGTGEPYGLINLNLARSVGRAGEDQYPDPEVMGFNPCQPEFATVLTKEGIRTFKDIDIGSEIWSKNGWTKVINKWSNGIKPVHKYKTTGGVFLGTETHRLVTKEGKKEARDCEEVRVISGNLADKIESYNPDMVMAGLFLGDGYYKKMRGREYEYPLLCIGENDHDYFDSEISHLILNKFSESGKKQEFNVNTNVSKNEKSHNVSLLKSFDNLYNLPKSDIQSLLRGLYTADGSVIKQKGNSVRITYKTASKCLSEEIQLLLSSIGIRSYITTNKERLTKFNNGEYTCKKSYDINITKDFREFYSLVGFIQKYKMEKIGSVIDLYKGNSKDMYTSMKEVEYIGDFEVFDITVDNDSHTYWSGGLDVSNCAEQSLAPYETCCLAEIHLPNIESEEELKEVATYLYRINKHSLALKCHHPETESIVHKNMRMGIGVTGYCMATKKQKSWLSKTYKYLREFDKEYSAKHGYPESIKLTTVKPSGTLSLLSGVTPGCHPGFSHYHIRRIRMASNIPLVDVARQNGYPIEFLRKFDGSEDRNTVVVSFPCAFPKNTLVAADCTAIDQLEVIKELQENWSDNSVSCTVYYTKGELPAIKRWLKQNYNTNLKTVSFLLHNDHGFDQAPLEEISKEEYDKLSAQVQPIVNCDVDENSILDDFECEGGVCPVK